MYILWVPTGGRDASACIYKDFELVAAVSLERLTRAKSAGVTPAQRMPNRAIDECLAIAGVGRGDIDVLALSRALFEYQDFALTGLSALEQAWWRLWGRRRLRLVDHMMRREGKTDASAIFRSERFLVRKVSAARACISTNITSPMPFPPISIAVSTRRSSIRPTERATASLTAPGSDPPAASSCYSAATRVSSGAGRGTAWRALQRLHRRARI